MTAPSNMPAPTQVHGLRPTIIVACGGEGVYSDSGSDSYPVLSQTLKNNLASSFLSFNQLCQSFVAATVANSLRLLRHIPFATPIDLIRGYLHFLCRCADRPRSQNQSLGSPSHLESCDPNNSQSSTQGTILRTLLPAS